MNQEGAATRFTADEGEAQKGEGLRFAEPALLSIGRRVATELQQSGLLPNAASARNSCNLSRMASQNRRGVALVLKTHDQVVGVSHDDHVARGLASSPTFGPEIEGVVQVDIGEERRNHRAAPFPCH